MADSMWLRSTSSILCMPTHRTFMCIGECHFTHLNVRNAALERLMFLSVKKRSSSAYLHKFIYKKRMTFWGLQTSAWNMQSSCVWMCGQSHCSSQGQGGEASFHSRPQAFVIVLKTLHPAPLAILRGEGHHSILPLGGGHSWNAKLRW